MLHEFGPDSNSNWNNINAISSIQFKSSDIAHLSSLSSFSVMPCSDVQGLEACERRAVVCIDVQGACSNCSSAGIDIYSNNCCVFWLTTSIHIINNLKINSMIRKSPNELKQARGARAHLFQYSPLRVMGIHWHSIYQVYP